MAASAVYTVIALPTGGREWGNIENWGYNYLEDYKIRLFTSVIILLVVNAGLFLLESTHKTGFGVTFAVIQLLVNVILVRINVRWKTLNKYETL